MMSQPVSVVLVAVGGYGNNYVNALLDQSDPPVARVVGVVDPYADRCRRIDELRDADVPLYADLDAFYSRHDAQLCVISSPIHLHCPQTCTALQHGSSVLCEKPLGAAIQDARRMIEVRDRQGGFVAIGYQWSFSAAMQGLKADVLGGRLGQPRRLRTLVLWPRNEAYYSRNNWAGAQKSPDGDWILDSPVNNATAHYLHNMFYVIGPAVDRSDMPTAVTGELYRANPISNYDTGVVRAVTEAGAEVLFYASHSVDTQRGPEFVYEFEEGTVCYEGRGSSVHAEFADGTTRDYGNPDEGTLRKLWDCVAAVSEGAPIVCGPEAASAQTLCMNGMQLSADIAEFPPPLVTRQGEEGTRTTLVEGLADALTEAYQQGRLPSESNHAWARVGKTMDLQQLHHFPTA